MPNYIKTYIERDVRQIKNISDLLIFEKFMRILAGRTGQELNLSAISNEVGVDLKTIQSWIGILESSFIIYLLKPYFQNFNKTIVKRPKVYFYDVGLVCAFLRINNRSQIETHPLRGAVFENMVVIETVKKYTNKGINPPLYFWRDKTGREIDLIIDYNNEIVPIEIKSGKTVNQDFFKSLNYFMEISKTNKAILAYAGNQVQNRSNGIQVKNWKDI